MRKALNSYVFSYLNALLDIKLAEDSPTHSIKKNLATSGEAFYHTRLSLELKKLCDI